MTDRAHGRPSRLSVVLLAVVVLASMALQQTPSAVAQEMPSPPKGVEAGPYMAEYEAIKATFNVCVASAGADKSALEACAKAAKEAVKALIKRIKEDGKGHEDHKHDDKVKGPVEVPTAPTGPLQDAPKAPLLSSSSTPAVKGPSFSMKILVIAGDGNEPQLGAIKTTLDHLGTPYDVLTSATQELTAEMLFAGESAKYQAVILTNGEAGYWSNTESAYVSGLRPDEWETLQRFEAAFKVRQVTWYTWPNPLYGLNYPSAELDTTITPAQGTLTALGRSVFPYLTTSPIKIDKAWMYLAKPIDPSTQPLLVDSAGNALISIRDYPDGRQNLAVTFDSNEYLVHTHQLGYGLINWATRGRFVGERRVYLDAQVDDFFFSNDLWDPADPTTMVSDYRMTGDDLKKTESWQGKHNKETVTKDLRLTMAFNGEGAGSLQPDKLLSEAQKLQTRFKWINHTWTHMNLDLADYASAYQEFKLNLDLASRLRLSDFSPVNLVTPEISGLFNPEALQAAADLGVKYVVSDTSRVADFGIPTPNTGRYNDLVPGILMIPRRPNNLFYNVSTPTEWVSEYNHMYRSYWGRDLTYAEILDLESQVLLSYLMRGEIYPWMFHQANLRFYDGKRSLLTDLLDVTLNKYKALFTLPIMSPRQDAIGLRIEQRMALNSASYNVTYHQGSNTIQISSNRGVVVPITGLRSGSSVAEYGGQTTSYVTVAPDQTVTIPAGR